MRQATKRGAKPFKGLRQHVNEKFAKSRCDMCRNKIRNKEEAFVLNAETSLTTTFCRVCYFKKLDGV